MLMLLIRLFAILILSIFLANYVLLKLGVYTQTLKKHQVVRDLKKFENHCFRETDNKTYGDWNKARYSSLCLLSPPRDQMALGLSGWAYQLGAKFSPLSCS